MTPPSPRPPRRKSLTIKGVIRNARPSATPLTPRAPPCPPSRHDRFRGTAWSTAGSLVESQMRAGWTSTPRTPRLQAVRKPYPALLEDLRVPQTTVEAGLSVLLRALSRDPTGTQRVPSFPIAWTSTKGQVRTENQDRVVAARSTDLALAVLADGMGGMRAGSRVAEVAAAAAAAWCLFSSPSQAMDGLLTHALQYANDEVFKQFRGEGGAALVIAAQRTGAWWIGHAGDARAYHLRETELEQLTVDDTVKGQLDHLGYSHSETPESGLLQFVGVGAELEPHVCAVPHGGRGIILTSDGVHSLPCSVFEWVVKHAKQLQASTERLAQVSEWHGGHDNATAVAIGLSSPNSNRVASRFVECWVPGEHLVLLHIADRHPKAAPTGMVPNQTSQTTAAQGPVDPAEPPTKQKTGTTKKRRSTKKKKPKSNGKKRTQPTELTSHADVDAQLPIVVFASPSEEATHAREGQSNVRDPKKGDERPEISAKKD